MVWQKWAGFGIGPPKTQEKSENQSGTWVGVLGALAGELWGAPNGTDSFLPVNGSPERFSDIAAFHLLENLQLKVLC